MHIPDNILNSQASIGLIAVSLVVGSFALKKVKDSLLAKTKVLVPQLVTNIGAEINSQRLVSRLIFRQGAQKKIQQMILVFCFVFTAQALDFIEIGEVSGHLIGSVLAAIVLGPWIGMVVVAGVLAVQALFLADGGIIALGANIFNMAIIGCLGGYYLYLASQKLFKNKYLAVGLAVWLSLILMAVFYSIELQAHFEMILVHAIVGIFEAIITIFALKFLFEKIYEK